MIRKAISTFFVIALCFGTSAAQDNFKTLERRYDPVIVKGDSCGIAGRNISDYALYASVNGHIVPIPFQIDERNKNDEFVLTNGLLASTDDDPSFDENDELVFMAKDAGEKIASAKSLPSGTEACVELEITDPVTGGKAWAYLVAGDDKFERSTVDYVSYDPRSSSFATANYSGRYDKSHPVGADGYAFEKGAGGDGKFFIDRIKVRLVMGSMGVTLHRSENDIKVRELGYIDGPVRVVVYTENVTPLVFGIPASTTRQYTYYYDSYADFAFAASFPLKPSVFRATIIDDFIDARGWRFYSSNNPGGHTIDGRNDSKDNALDLSTWRWCAISNDKNCFWSLWEGPKGCPVAPTLYFNDDALSYDGIEEIKGETPGIGFDFASGWERLEADRVEFRLIHFFTSAYKKGMEKEICGSFDAPLRVKTSIL